MKLRFCWVVGWRYNVKRQKICAVPMMASMAMRTGLVGMRWSPWMRMGTKLVQRQTMIRISLKKNRKKVR